MKRFQEFVKNEVDVEFFCCVWAMTMIFLYGLELYLYGVKEVPFSIIFLIIPFSPTSFSCPWKSSRVLGLYLYAKGFFSSYIPSNRFIFYLILIISYFLSDVVNNFHVLCTKILYHFL